MNIGECILQRKISFLPYELANWNTLVPTFYINKYPHLDVGTNTLRATLRTTTAKITERTKSGKTRDFIRTILQNLVQEHGTQHKLVILFIDALAQMCIKEYNLEVFDIIRSRWLKHAPEETLSFAQAANLTKEAKNRTEILYYDTLDDYFGEEGLGI